MYSLGNFIFETETVSVQPYEAYCNKGMQIDTRGAYIDKRSRNGTAGYPTQENIWRSVLISWTAEDREITQIQLYPISLGMSAPRSQRGVHVLTNDSAILEYPTKLSKPLGTTIRIENNVGYIDL